ncbi:TATA-binding protein-associated phosphoprotein [Entamoeba marina]
MDDKKKNSSKEKFKRWKDYQSLQEAVLGLLNKHCDIVYRNPFKKTVVTVQFISVDKLIFTENDVVDVIGFIQQRCKERMECDIQNGVSQKTAMRRYDNNKFSETLHLLCDLLIELGFQFQTTKTPAKDYQQTHETVVDIYNNDGFLFGKVDIMNKGKRINDYLCSMFTKTGEEYKIKKKNAEIIKILQN